MNTLACRCNRLQEWTHTGYGPTLLRVVSEEGPLAVWGPLFRRSVWAAASINWGGLLAEALTRQGTPDLWLPRGLLSCVMITLLYVPGLSLHKRAWLLAFTLFFTQAFILASVPW
jgi:hypothetical protein